MLQISVDLNATYTACDKQCSRRNVDEKRRGAERVRIVMGEDRDGRGEERGIGEKGQEVFAMNDIQIIMN